MQQHFRSISRRFASLSILALLGGVCQPLWAAGLTHGPAMQESSAAIQAGLLQNKDAFTPSTSVPRLPQNQINCGISSVVLTPGFERYNDINGDMRWDIFTEEYYDTGKDGLYSYQEPGAFGPDGKPGWANVDDDGDGKIDNCDWPDDCKEWGWRGTDDVMDPNGDDYDLFTNPDGKEGNGQFDYSYVGGFGIAFPLVPMRVFNGVHDDIYSRTVVLEKDGNWLVMVSTDFPGLLWKNINPVKRRIERELGIPYDNVIITSTHNHQGPDATGYWLTLAGGYDREYMDFVENGIFESVREAKDTMVPTYMKINEKNTISCYNPRTLEIKREPDCRNPTYLEAFRLADHNFDIWLMQNDLRDPIIRNTTVTAFKWDAVDTGDTVGTLVFWNNHPEILGSDNVMVSSDFVGYTRQRMELEFGGTCVYITGTLGNQIGALRGTPAPLVDLNWNWVYDPVKRDIHGNRFPVLVGEGNHDKIRSIGAIVAETAIDALNEKPYVDPNPTISVLTEQVDVKLDNLLYEIIGGSLFAGTQPEDGMITSDYCNNTWGCIRCDLSVVRLGEAEFATMPGEVDPTYLYGRDSSIAIYEPERPNHYFPMKKGLVEAMSGRYKFIIGSGNNYLSYLIHEDDFLPLWEQEHPNYYEDLVTYGRHFGDSVGNKLFMMLGSPLRFDYSVEVSP